MPVEELDFSGIEASETTRSTRSHSARVRRKNGGFRTLLLTVLGISLAADVLILTFFMMPVAIGWHFALLWLCVAWSVLGAGSLLVRTGAAMLTWCIGIIPIFPAIWLGFDGLNGIMKSLLVLCCGLVPSYAAFWCYRVYFGQFIRLPGVKLAAGQTKVVQEGLPQYKIGLSDLFRMTTYCAIALGVVVPVINFFMQNQESEVLILAALVIPAVFLLPTIQLVCQNGRSPMHRAFKYLLILCIVLCVLLVAVLTALTGDPQGSLFVAAGTLFTYFSAGGFVIAGLSTLRDQGYRFGRIKVENAS